MLAICAATTATTSEGASKQASKQKHHQPHHPSTIRGRTTPFGWDSKSRIWKHCAEQHVHVVYSSFPLTKQSETATFVHPFGLPDINSSHEVSKKLKKHKGQESEDSPMGTNCLPQFSGKASQAPQPLCIKSKYQYFRHSFRGSCLKIRMANPNRLQGCVASEIGALSDDFLWAMSQICPVLHDHCHLGPATSQNPPQRRQNLRLGFLESFLHSALKSVNFLSVSVRSPEVAAEAP